MRSKVLESGCLVVLLVAVAACSPPPAGGGDPAPSDASDVFSFDFGFLFEADGIGGPPELVVFVDDVKLTEEAFVLPKVLPGPGAEARIKVQIANFGAMDMSLTRVELLPVNADASMASKWMRLDWGKLDPSTAVPAKLVPHSTDHTSVLQLQLVYTPAAADDASATMVIDTDVPGAVPRIVRFAPPPLAPRIVVEPSQFTFWEANLVASQKQTFAVHNEGMLPLRVEGVVFTSMTQRFRVLETPEQLAGAVAPKGSAAYGPMHFTVEYQPIFGSKKDAVGLTVLSDDPESPHYVVQLDGAFETTPDMSPCAWDAPATGLLDFSSVLEGKDKKTLRMTNVGQSACTLNSVKATGDPKGKHWIFLVELLPEPGSEAPPTLVDMLPVGVSAGRSLDVHVIYKAGEAGVDSPIVIEYGDPMAKTLELQGVGGKNKPCLKYIPTAGGSPLPLSFVGAHSQSMVQSFFVSSCGIGKLTIDEIAITDTIIPGDKSTFFAINSPGSKDIQIAPGDVQQFSVGAVAPAAGVGSEVDGTMSIHYLAASGAAVLPVPVSIRVDAEAVLPTADPGPPEAYAEAVAGKQLTLDGSASLSNQPGTSAPGEGLDPSGYLWFVIKAPDGSAAKLPGTFGGAKVSFKPDVPGTYQIGLIVRTPKPNELYSHIQLLVLSVAAP